MCHMSRLDMYCEKVIVGIDLQASDSQQIGSSSSNIASRCHMDLVRDGLITNTRGQLKREHATVWSINYNSTIR